MNTAMKTWLLVLAFAGLFTHTLLSQEKPQSPVAPTVPTAPVATPAATPAGEVEAATTCRLRNLTPSARKKTYDGTLIRLRQRAQPYKHARNSEEAKWQRGVDNVSFDSMTHRPMGINVFAIQY